MVIHFTRPFLPIANFHSCLRLWARRRLIEWILRCVWLCRRLGIGRRCRVPRQLCLVWPCRLLPLLRGPVRSRRRDCRQFATVRRSRWISRLLLCPRRTTSSTKFQTHNLQPVKVYRKTRIVRVPFISRISRPWQPRENNGSLIYTYFSRKLLVQSVQTPKLRAPK